MISNIHVCGCCRILFLVYSLAVLGQAQFELGFQAADGYVQGGGRCWSTYGKCEAGTSGRAQVEGPTP